MRITHLGHASLLVEIADTRILLDPGVWSPGAADQRDVAAVLVTHQHPDHLDQDRLPALLAANPSAQVLTDPDTAKLLQDKGIDARAVVAGDVVEVGAVTVTGVGELHALIHEDLPRIHNTGMLLRAEGEPTFFHPGDALDAEPGPVDVLAFPLDELGDQRDDTDGDDVPPTLLGDVVLCPEVAAAQAEQAGHSLEDELHLLCTHGILHLLGYYHGDAEEEREMFGLQGQLLTRWTKAR